MTSLLLALMLTFPSADFVFYDATSGAACEDDYYEPFASTLDTTTNWTEAAGTWATIDDGPDSDWELESPSARGTLIWQEPLCSDDGWLCWEAYAVNARRISGVFRLTSDDPGTDTDFYWLRPDTPNTWVNWDWRHCADDTMNDCTDIQSQNYGTGFSAGDYVCMDWSGTGSSTVLNLYDCGTSDPTNGPSDCGAAVLTFTDDPPGSGCDGTGGGCAADSGAYVGIGDGVNGQLLMDNFRAGSD